MPPALIALDWGTSSLRGFLVEARGSALDEITAPLGIMKVTNAGFEAAFEQVCGPWFQAHGALPTLACGMIGARQGWVEAQYVPCPADGMSLAVKLTRFTTSRGRAFAIVPGLKVESASGVPDVMRGEETQIIGALQHTGASEGLFVLPGTHSKWASVRGRRIEAFATFVTGEVFALLCEHSILGKPMSSREDHEDAFAQGCQEAQRDASRAAGLLHQLFSARTLGLFNRVPAEGLYSYLSGLLIGAEIVGAKQLYPGAKAVTLIGEARLCSLYRRALTHAGIEAASAPQSVTLQGLVVLAREAGLLR